MKNSSRSHALIIGHPGHELRVFKFIQEFKPRVYILTDGSGKEKSSRVHSSRRILENLGASCSEIMGVFSDVELYDIILNRELVVLEQLLSTIYHDLVAHDIDFVFGDAIEGFNPTHDLCRYLINVLAEIYLKKEHQEIKNYDFNLDTSPEVDSGNLKWDLLTNKLNEEEIQAKILAARSYGELKEEVEYALQKFGKEAFRNECLRPVNDRRVLKNWQTSIPLYETYGQQRVSDGRYQQIITFRDHVEPLANQLWGLVQKY